MFGGESNRRISLEDTWVFDFDTNLWAELEPQDVPSEVDGSTAAYDSESDRIIFYFTTKLDSSATNGLVRISETWAYDVSANTWTNMNPNLAPFGLMGSRMVYDSESDRIILFGGTDYTLKIWSRFTETWAYDFNTNTWAQMNPAEIATGRSYFGMSYDIEADRVLVFGDSLPSDSENQANEMWAYNFNVDTWEQIKYIGEPPIARSSFMTYAPDMNKSLYLVEQDFWAFDYASKSWQELIYDDALATRYFHGMAFGSESQVLVVFGGGSRGLQYDNKTWKYDTVSGIWELGGIGH